MTFSTFISADELCAHLNDPDWVIIDCRFDLSNPSWGREDYLRSHIPGAVFADIELDLSGPVTPDSGRHPLPDPDTLAKKFGQWGIGPDTQVVAYDSQSGSYAARLWYLLRLCGHTRVSILEGDFNLWLQEGYPQRSCGEHSTAREFTGTFDQRKLISAGELLRLIGSDQPYQLVDSRAPQRYRGEIEPIDRVAGHIPGAVNRFHGENLTPEGRLKPAEQLRAEFLALLDGFSPEQAVFYCGSGVTACFNLAAMEAAGLPGANLYPGGWSEWIQDPERPIQRG